MSKEIPVPDSAAQIVVIDQDGIRGLIDVQDLDRQDQTQILITYDGNRHAQVPITMLQAQMDGTYSLPLRLSTLTTTAQHLDNAKDMVIPVIEEEAHINKRAVERGRVRITKQVQVEEETLDALLKQQRVQVDRIPLEQMVNKAATPMVKPPFQSWKKSYASGSGRLKVVVCG